MTKKGIWLACETTKDQIETIKKIAPDYEVIEGWKDTAFDFPLEDIEIIYGWKGQKSDELLKKENSRIKWIQGKAAGVDFLDLASLKEKGVWLTNGSGIHSIPIAESVFGMLLAYTRGIQASIKNQLVKNWEEAERLIELHEKTIMIVGTGKIGKEVGRLAQAFNMKTIGVNSSGHEADYMDQVISQEDLIQHINEADIVVNILPLTDKTTAFFNESVFNAMKKNTLFLNVGRGPTVETDSLLHALDAGQVAFAGLDVFETEPLEAESPLWEHENVLVTPHISGIAEHFKKRLFAIFEKNLKAYVAGEELPENLIDYKKSY